MKKFYKLVQVVAGFGMLASTAVAGEYKVEHAMGTATITDNPQKIVMLTNEGTEALVALGIKPVGAAKSWNGDPDFYPYIKGDLEGTVAVGLEHKINLESIVELEPDLIIGIKTRHEKIYPQFLQIAPTVMSETLKGKMLENVVLYGQAVGKEDEAKQLVANFKARVQKLRSALGDSLNEEISIVRFMPNHVRIMQLDSFSGRVMKEIGFKRTAANNVDAFAEKTESKERIPAMDGDRIFFFKWDDAKQKSSDIEKEWMNETMWKNLSAVKAGKLHRVNDTFWNTSGGIISANKMLDAIAEIYNVKID